MKIGKNKFVSLVYELRENDSNGRIIEELDSTKPLSFVYGAGRIISGFETGISTLSQGDDFGFKVAASEAYGDRRDDMVVDVPLSIFMKEGEVDEDICFVGNTVPMSDSQGRRIDGVINEITDETVVMDFNHPMAGVDLFFSGKVAVVRDATDEEINPPHTHGSSCSGCGSGSTGCGGEC
jgi:FKBP-type peptidyl-prolyl cis-trans isomerase SlyD